MGSSQAMVACRRKSYRERDRLVNRFTEKYVRITGGSKAEGYSSCFESDYDRLNVYKTVVCMCGQCECRNVAMEPETVFLLNGEKCHPGHFYLELLRLSNGRAENGRMGNEDHSDLSGAKPVLENTREDVIIRSLVGVDEKCLLSSDRFMHEHETDMEIDINGGWKRSDRSGPSVPSTRGLYRRDDVFAFRCPCQRHLLAEWASRRRQFSWPTPDLIKAVLETDAHAVPVGCPGSDRKCLEWRICFGERVLSDSFNQTQSILYILLKMINTTVITPVCSDLSSYVMKNITFWLIEENPAELFTEENLLHLLKLAFQMLHKAVQTMHLSYYMISDRNLLQGRICPREQRDLLEVINTSMNDVQKLLSNLPKICKAMSVPEEELRAEGKVRNKLESLELYRQEIIAFYWRPNLKREEVDELCWQDGRYRDARFKMYDIVWPDWKSQFRQGNNVEQGHVVQNSTNESASVLNERYLKFAESYYEIIWPHMKRCLGAHAGIDVGSLSREKVIKIMAVMRLKIEQALS